MSKTITIHQPDFMPWLGLYNKIAKADEWILLDHVHNNPRDSAFWCRRVKLLINGTPSWVTVPLVKPAGIVSVPINEMQLNTGDVKNISRTLASIRMSYARAPYFKEVFPLVESYFLDPETNLVKRNLSFFRNTLDLLDLNPVIIYSSSMNCTEKATALLIEICQKRQADIYLCGQGASGYQDDDMFRDHSINLRFNRYSQPAYTQFNSPVFQPGLSAVDAFMNVGFKAARDLIISG